MQRRTFLRTAAATAAGSVLAQQSIERGVGRATISELAVDSTSSLLDASQEPLTDDSLVAVWAESTAENVDSDGNDDAVAYGDDRRIPLVAVDGSVVGLGAMLVPDDTNFRYGNEEFLLNIWDDVVGSGTVLWDESHGQYYTLDGENAGGSPGFTTFETYAEDNGYTVEATDDLTGDLSDADAVVVTSPSESFSSDERDALTEFVDDGGAVLLHDQSDYNDFDQTANLNDVAAALGVGFRFNDDQVEDEENNTGAPFVPTTGQFNTSFPFFADREGLGLELDPDEEYEVVVTDVTDGDTVDVAFVEERGQPEKSVRILGIDTPETAVAASAERPEEWEGIADDAPQPPEGGNDDGDDTATRNVGPLNFYSTSSLVDESETALTDESLVAVWAEATATNEDADGNGDAYVYEDERIPLAAVDDDAGVVGFGASLVSDGADLDGPGTEDEFVLNVWDEQLGGSGTVHWDEGHDQFEDYRLENFSAFESAAEDAGYTVEPTTSVPSDTDTADGYVVVTPDEGATFTEDERESLREFVDDGGVVFCHGVSDYNDFDGTGTLNGVLGALDAGFRFNDDQVVDDENNEGAPFDLLTAAFNTDEFPYLDSSLAPVGAEYPYLADWGARASRFAAAELSVGSRLTLSFDPEAQIYDSFGRLLGYLTYDATGDGDRETLYNTEVIRQGYARVYGSSFSRHDEFWAVEDAAREAGRGLWAASNPDESPPIRDGPVEEVFCPNPASIVRGSRPVPPGHVRLFAESSATQENAETEYDRDIPLGAVDKDANVAYLGAPLVSEDYETGEGYPVDTAAYGNFAFVTNVIDELSDDDGPVLIDGGRDQFSLDYALSSEDAAYYQRYLEGQDTAFEQVNDLTSSASADRLDDATALIVTTPRYGFTDEETEAVSSFADDGGAVVLMGSGRAPSAQRSYLDDVAAGVGSDLRLGSGRVVDAESNLDGDAAVLTTTNFGPGRGKGHGNGNGNGNGSGGNGEGNGNGRGNGN